jgi:hypothetical protein
MPNNNWDSLALWNDGLGADMTSMSAAQVDGLAGKTIPKFATTAARDTATAAFTTAGGSAEGLFCHVTAKGFYGYTGGSWRLNGVKRLAYAQPNSYTISAGIDATLGSWPDSNGFTGNASGITVPEDGVYCATLTVSSFSAVVLNRYYVELQAAATAARTPGYSPTPNVEGRISVSMNAVPLGAGGVIGCQFGHNFGGTLSIAGHLAVVRVSP